MAIKCNDPVITKLENTGILKKRTSPGIQGPFSFEAEQ